MLHTRFSDLFDLQYPVMSAPMTLHCGATLAAAVSSGGGMGSLAGLHASLDPEAVRADAAAVRARTDRPFAIGFITDFIAFAPSLFGAALEQRPALVALSFGDPAPWIERCHAADIKVICQVQTCDDADRAVAAGTDLLAAQGNEAGGHTGRMNLLPLLTAVAQRHAGCPVLAAGGIGDGASLAAALLAGADGAWVGTSFLATPEAVEVDDAYKQMIVQSDGADTVFTRVYDILSPYPWPRHIGERVRRNRFTDDWSEREEELEERKAEVAAARGPALPGQPGDPDTREVLYGQSARCVTEIRPAVQVMAEICDEAERVLRTRPGSLLR